MIRFQIVGLFKVQLAAILRKRCIRQVGLLCSLCVATFVGRAVSQQAEALPLKRAVELALTHGTAAMQWQADEQRAFASYQEAKYQYLPQVIIGSGLGQSWGFPLSLEGSAPSLFNVNSQSTVFNASLRDYIRSAKTDYSASLVQSKDQRNQLIQDTILAYAELCKWQALTGHLHEQQAASSEIEQAVDQRIQEGIDNPLQLKQAKLSVARVRLRIAEAQGSMEVLRVRLARLTGLADSSIVVDPSSIPALPETRQDEDLSGKAIGVSPVIKAADFHTTALFFRARAEHRALWPSLDFAAQYALLSNFNNYSEFYSKFERNNATIGLSFRFPILNFSQRAHARAADAEALKSKAQAQAARNQVSEETLRLQRAVAQSAAAQEVASLENDIAQSNLETVQVRMDASTATLHDSADATTQAGERFNSLQDANFELQKARISLLRATGDLEMWLGIAK